MALLLGLFEVVALLLSLGGVLAILLDLDGVAALLMGVGGVQPLKLGLDLVVVRLAVCLPLPDYPLAAWLVSW